MTLCLSDCTCWYIWGDNRYMYASTGSLWNSSLWAFTQFETDNLSASFDEAPSELKKVGNNSFYVFSWTNSEVQTLFVSDDWPLHQDDNQMSHVYDATQVIHLAAKASQFLFVNNVLKFFFVPAKHFCLSSNQIICWMLKCPWRIL